MSMLFTPFCFAYPANCDVMMTRLIFLDPEYHPSLQCAVEGVSEIAVVSGLCLVAWRRTLGSGMAGVPRT